MSSHRAIDILNHSPRWVPLKLGPKIEESITVAADHLGLPQFDLCIVLADDAFIQELNAQYRGKDKPTDVLSFPQHDFTPGDEIVIENLNLGDIILSYETVSKDAEAQGKNLSDHVRHMIVHGFLHLLGYDHQDEEPAMEMETLEGVILDKLHVANPYQ